MAKKRDGRVAKLGMCGSIEWLSRGWVALYQREGWLSRGMGG